ncbi:hypothetical protein EV184_12954 [Sinorhizobium americanum]|uniref:Uncharacterized protein n=1 Tax=Sinorhizobium americanum TaxID=194963 RepID=A0A4R2B1J7_9HYPH|nr:hypothetical protein EV184_12954 [Sinorhizobium americanum]
MEPYSTDCARPFSAEHLRSPGRQRHARRRLKYRASRAGSVADLFSRVVQRLEWMCFEVARRTRPSQSGQIRRDASSCSNHDVPICYRGQATVAAGCLKTVLGSVAEWFKALAATRKGRCRDSLDWPMSLSTRSRTLVLIRVPGSSSRSPADCPICDSHQWTAARHTFDFRHPAAQASNSEQNQRSPYCGLIFVCE